MLDIGIVWSFICSCFAAPATPTAQHTHIHNSPQATVSAAVASVRVFCHVCLQKCVMPCQFIQWRAPRRVYFQCNSFIFRLSASNNNNNFNFNCTETNTKSKTSHCICNLLRFESKRVNEREGEGERSRARCSYVMFLLVKLHNFQSLSVSLFLFPVLLRSLARVARVPPRRLATLQMQSLYLPLTLHLYLCVFDFVKRFITQFCCRCRRQRRSRRTVGPIQRNQIRNINLNY